MCCETFYISSSCLLLSGFIYKLLSLAIGKPRIHYVLRNSIMNYLLICSRDALTLWFCDSHNSLIDNNQSWWLRVTEWYRRMESAILFGWAAHVLSSYMLKLSRFSNCVSVLNSLTVSQTAIWSYVVPERAMAKFSEFTTALCLQKNGEGKKKERKK